MELYFKLKLIFEYVLPAVFIVIAIIGYIVVDIKNRRED